MAALAFSFAELGPLAPLVYASRLHKLRAALAAGEIITTGANLHLRNSDFCENIDPEFCKQWKIYVERAQILLLTGQGSAVLYSKFLKVRKRYDLIEDKKEDLINAISDPKEKAAFVHMMGLELDILTKLKNTFNKINAKYPSLIDELYKAVDPNQMKLFELENAIKALDDIAAELPTNGKEFFKDLIATAKIDGKIGKNLANLTEGQVKAWKVAKNMEWPSTNVEFLSALNNRMNHPKFPLTETLIEDIVVRADILDETLGSNEVRNLITELLGNKQFINHEDILKNIDECFVDDVPNISKLNTQLNEFYEGQYWISRGENVKISKQLNPGQQYNNEVDGLLLTREGILECKYPNVPGANAQNNIFANLRLIIKKFTTDSKLTQNWKDLYPKKYGQINIANGSFSDLKHVDEFVQAVKDAGIIGNEAGISLFTKAELKSLDELHILVNNKRIIINPADWD